MTAIWHSTANAPIEEDSTKRPASKEEIEEYVWSEVQAENSRWHQKGYLSLTENFTLKLSSFKP